jgi:hypothetical protein
MHDAPPLPLPLPLPLRSPGPSPAPPMAAARSSSATPWWRAAARARAAVRLVTEACPLWRATEATSRGWGCAEPYGLAWPAGRRWRGTSSTTRRALPRPASARLRSGGRSALAARRPAPRVLAADVDPRRARPRRSTPSSTRLRARDHDPRPDRRRPRLGPGAGRRPFYEAALGGGLRVLRAWPARRHGAGGRPGPRLLHASRASGRRYDAPRRGLDGAPRATAVYRLRVDGPRGLSRHTRSRRHAIAVPPVAQAAASLRGSRMVAAPRSAGRAA